MRTLCCLLALSCGSGPRTDTTHQALTLPSRANIPETWVSVGDSTMKDNANQSQGWPTQVQAMWPGHDVQNLAIPGSTIIDGGPGFPTVRDQWLSVRGSEARGLFLQGGYNEMIREYYTGDDIFDHQLLVANDALDGGWLVALVPPLPCGGSCDNNQEGKRQVMKTLQAAWAVEHAQLFVDLDEAPINCGALFGNNIPTLCDFARYGGTDVVHPSPEAQRLIGQYVADRLNFKPEVFEP